MKGNEPLNKKTMMWMLAVMIVFEIIEVKCQNTAREVSPNTRINLELFPLEKCTETINGDMCRGGILTFDLNYFENYHDG